MSEYQVDENRIAKTRSITEIIPLLLDNDALKVVQLKASGLALRDIAEQLSITRTEARQIEKRGIEMILDYNYPIEEDRLKYTFEHYQLGDDFYSSLEQGSLILYYLRLKYIEGTRSIESAINDTAVPEDIRALLSNQNTDTNTPAADFDTSIILDRLNLGQYQNIEISSRLIYQDNEVFLNNYDIKDEYELYQWFEKNNIQKQIPGLTLIGAPVVRFGYFNRSEVVKATLVSMVPISVRDFMDYLSKTYGLDDQTIQSAWLDDIECYRQGDEYRTDFINATGIIDSPIKLVEAIDSIWDIFLSCGITNKLTIIEQFSYLVFMKYIDETMGNATVNNIFGDRHQDCRWSYFRHLDGEELLNHIKNTVFPFICSELRTDTDISFAKYLADAQFLIPSSISLVHLMDSLDAINSYPLNIVYKYMLSKAFSERESLEYNAFDEMVNMMVNMVSPSLEDTICDPLAKTGTLLTTTARYVSEKYLHKLSKLWNRNHYRSAMFSGYNLDITQLRISSLYLLLLGIPSPNLIQDDAMTACAKARKYSCIITCAPFTGSVNPDVLPALSRELAPGKKIDPVYIASCLQLLEDNGRCAVIVPQDFLFDNSKSYKSIRKHIVCDNTLDAVVTMPSDNFAILIFRKAQPDQNHKVWFAAPHDMEMSTQTEVVRRFLNLDNETNRERNSASFLVDIEEIKEKQYILAHNLYSENNEITEEASNTRTEPSNEIIKRIRVSEQTIETLLSELKSLLN